MSQLIKGDTVTIAVAFNPEYDPERLIDITVGIFGGEVARLSTEGVFPTDDPRVFLVKLTSNTTRRFTGGVPLTIAVTDTILRVKHTTPYTLYFVDSPFSLQDSGTKDAIDVTVTITIGNAGLSTNSYLASIYRGYSAYEIAKYKYGYAGTETEWNNAVNAARVLAEAAAATATEKAGNANTSAIAAAQSAVNANNSAIAANTSAIAANSSAESAYNSAIAANGSAVAAGQSAANATTKAAEASASAANATTKAAEAVASATQAASSAASAAAIVTGQSTGQSDVLPAVNWQFAKSKVLPRAITFSRNSIATYFDAQGILRTARNHEPCFDHDPLTGESLGLASWEARTNIAWGIGAGNANVILTPNAGVAPDGTNTAILAQNTPGTTSFTWSNCVSPLPNGIYTRSIFVKAASANAILFFEGVGDTIPGGGTVNFNINTLTWAGGSMGFLIDKGFHTLKNGWIRVWIVVEKSDTKNAGGNTHYVGSGALNHSFYMWGPQVELGTFPTPYIPTVSGAVVRQETTISVTASLMPVGGTFSAEAKTFATTGIQSFLQCANGDDFLRLCYNNTSVLLQSNVGGSTVLNFGLVKSRSNYVKAAFLYALNNVRLSLDGAAVLVDNSVALFTQNTFRLAENLNGHIRYLQYYPVALSDTQLQLLTSSGANLIGDKASQLPTASKLGGMAYLSYAEIAALRQRVELNFQGTGAQVSYTIRRPYPFTLAFVNQAGSTTATLPTAPAGGVYLADENYTLLHNAAVGTILTVELIPNI